MTLQELTSTVQNKLNQRFGSAIISLETQYDSPIFTIDKEQIADILLFLYHDTELSFQFLTTLCGLHYPDQIGKELGVMYQLHSLPNNFRIRLKAWMPISEPKIPTVTTVFASANWQERETFDFYGIQFVGHPNLKRILNMDEMNYFPFRKEYPLEDMRREDKNDNMFGR
jgi:NADH-quinone oxidoreductase subunit C